MFNVELGSSEATVTTVQVESIIKSMVRGKSPQNDGRYQHRTSRAAGTHLPKVF